MKILYYTLQRAPLLYINHNERADYLSDQLFHGLRSLFGNTVLDYPRKDYMYKDYKDDPTRLWGKGFSYAKILDNTNPWAPLEPLFLPQYDIIVLSVHHTMHKSHQEIEKTLTFFKNNFKGKIIVVDGNDESETYNFAFNYTPFLFKREIPDGADPRLIPISFAIPKEKVLAQLKPKVRTIAPIIPSDHHHPNRATHIYNDEQSYYDNYAESYFGITTRKGGWDCMRHYEIMANGCIPIFGDIELCPKRTLTTLDKLKLSLVKTNFDMFNKVFDKNNIPKKWILQDNNNLYLKLCEEFRKEALEKHTTLSLATYVLDKIK